MFSNLGFFMSFSDHKAVLLVFFVFSSTVSTALFADFYFLEISDYAFQRFFVVVLVGFSLIFSLSFLDFRVFLNNWPVVVLGVSFVFWGRFCGGQEVSLVEPIMYLFFFVGAVMFGEFIKLSGNDRKTAVILALVAAGGVALYGCASLTVYGFVLLDGVPNFSHYIPWGFVNIRYWSHIATWFLPILPLATLIGPLKGNRLWRFFVALGVALWWWIVFMSTSRGTFLSLTLGVSLVALLMGRSSYPWLKIFFRYLVYGVGAWLVLSVIIPSVFLDNVTVREIKTDSAGRIVLFDEAWRMSLVNFPFGMGPQSWLTHDVITDAYRRFGKYGHPHNMYLMWAAEYGWLLIITSVPFVVQSISRFWRRRCKIIADQYEAGCNTRAISLAAFSASVASALVHAGVSAVFMAPASMMVGFIVLSVYWALIAPGVRNRPISNRPYTVSTVLASVVAVVWFLWFCQVQDYYRAMEVDLEYYLEHGSSGMLPRFWFHGNFPRAGDEG